MKKIIFLIGSAVFFLISCSTGKHARNQMAALENFKKPDSSENYFGSDNAISEEAAKKIIAKFPKHNYRGWRKKRLNSAWGFFDTTDLKKVVNNVNVEEIKFFWGAIDKDGDKNVPTIVLQAKIRKTSHKPNGKGSSGEQLFVPETYQYIISIGLCPPPDGDCAVEN